MVCKCCTIEIHTKMYLCPTAGGITYLLHLLVLCTVKNPSNSPQHAACCQRCLLMVRPWRTSRLSTKKDKLRKNNPFLQKNYMTISNLSKFFKNWTTKRAKIWVTAHLQDAVCSFDLDLKQGCLAFWAPKVGSVVCIS